MIIISHFFHQLYCTLSQSNLFRSSEEFSESRQFPANLLKYNIYADPVFSFTT